VRVDDVAGFDGELLRRSELRRFDLHDDAWEQGRTCACAGIRVVATRVGNRMTAYE
jgi:hypothetical protein